MPDLRPYLAQHGDLVNGFCSVTFASTAQEARNLAWRADPSGFTGSEDFLALRARRLPLDAFAETLPETPEAPVCFTWWECARCEAEGHQNAQIHRESGRCFRCGGPLALSP